jgi:stage II sporulation protein P
MATAQVMTVLGSDGRGLPHPNWRQNLSLGVLFSKKLNELYPGLSRGVNLKLGRFNQYVSPNAILIEVGANGNTLDEALNSTQCIGSAIAKILNK